MQTALFDVLEFHEKMGLAIGDPCKPDLSVDTQLRWDLIHEEFEELTLALKGLDSKGRKLEQEDQVIAVADALGDMCYVIAGAAATWGIDLGGVFQAIHTSNMTKSADHKRGDGKILKGPNYVPPKIAEALEDAKHEAPGDDTWWPTPTVKSGLEPLKEIDKEASFFGEHELPGELASQIMAKSNPPNAFAGYFTSHSYIFDCTRCSRTHTVPLKNGARGGAAKDGAAECMCGMRFEFEFEFGPQKEIAKGKEIDLSEGH